MSIEPNPRNPRNPWIIFLSFWSRRPRLEQITAILLPLAVILQAADLPLSDLTTIAAAITGGIVAFRYLRVAFVHLMWRLRHRLLVTYVFIGVVPVLLLLTMAALAGYVFYSQVATNLVEARIQQLQQELAVAARAAARSLPHNATAEIAERELRANLPEPIATVPLNVVPVAPRPAWLQSDFAGLVRGEQGHELRVAVPRGSGILLVSSPLSPALLTRICSGIGAVRLFDVDALNQDDRLTAGRRPRVRAQGGLLREPTGRFDIAIKGLLTAPYVDWTAGPQRLRALMLVTTRPSLINAKLFSAFGGSGLLTALTVIGVAFLVIEVVSLLIGIRLTRTITRATADLYEGTERIHAGDFGWRIPVRSRDQLAALAESFNGMTASLAQLIQEQKEKQRLQSELEIARTVQARLFPREVPVMGGLELAGVCHPARTVSGDYYDFEAIDGRYLALAIGDIAGKGISAALLMASIQSMLRAQLPPSMADGAAGSRNGHFATSALVSQLNRQLQKSIAPGHFATFCLALYDDASGELTYTNAGHLPPIVMRNGSVNRLKAGGTVLGVFPSALYDQETVRLESDDVFVAFTDGVTEPENSYGEEFGEDRLLDVLRRTAGRPPAEIAAAVITAVRDWTGSPAELQDDMTVLVARRRRSA